MPFRKEAKRKNDSGDTTKTLVSISNVILTVIVGLFLLISVANMIWTWRNPSPSVLVEPVFPIEMAQCENPLEQFSGDLETFVFSCEGSFIIHNISDDLDDLYVNEYSEVILNGWFDERDQRWVVTVAWLSSDGMEMTTWERSNSLRHWVAVEGYSIVEKGSWSGDILEMSNLRVHPIGGHLCVDAEVRPSCLS